KFGLGLSSSWSFTRYAGLTLGIGLIVGLFAGLANGLTRCKPLLTAICFGLFVLVVMGSIAVSTILAGSLPPNLFWSSMEETLVNGTTGGAVAWLTALAAIAIDNRL